MLGLEEYARGFTQGLNYVLYKSTKEDREVPVIDERDLTSIGYYDGFNYGEDLERIHMTMGISNEQLVAEIDKRHTRAINKYSVNLNVNIEEKGHLK